MGAASFVRALIAWYDLFLYGLAAALVFDELFLPSEDPPLGRLAAFASFAVGLFARQVGGALFGSFGTGSGVQGIGVAGVGRS